MPEFTGTTEVLHGSLSYDVHNQNFTRSVLYITSCVLTSTNKIT